jgi:hypothetical protein
MQHYRVWIQVKGSQPSVVGLVETLVGLGFVSGHEGGMPWKKFCHGT